MATGSGTRGIVCSEGCRCSASHAQEVEGSHVCKKHPGKKLVVDQIISDSTLITTAMPDSWTTPSTIGVGTVGCWKVPRGPVGSPRVGLSCRCPYGVIVLLRNVLHCATVFLTPLGHGGTKIGAEMHLGIGIESCCLHSMQGTTW